MQRRKRTSANANLNDSDENMNTSYIVKRKQSNRATANCLSDDIKPVADVSIAVYQALLANSGGFPEEGEEMCTTVKALTLATQTLKFEINDNEQYNTIIDLVCLFNLHVAMLILYLR